MENTLKKYSDTELRRELARRDAKKTKLEQLLISPIGTWRVTTEADVEGRGTTELGTFTGHIVDIAFKIGAQACYGLTFYRVDETKLWQDKTDECHIQLDVRSGTWDMDRAARADAIGGFLCSEKAEADFAVAESNYYGSVLIKKTDK